MFVSGITSLVGSAIFFGVRVPLITAVAHDDELSAMIISVVPYIALCQPMVSLATTGAYFNRALAMYKRSTKIELFITIFVTLPLAWVSTFIYGWDISGFAAATFIGYATTGTLTLAIFHNADWEKAVRKNRKIAGKIESPVEKGNAQTEIPVYRDDHEIL